MPPILTERRDSEGPFRPAGGKSPSLRPSTQSRPVPPSACQDDIGSHGHEMPDRYDRRRSSIGLVTEDLVPALARFHREVLLPDVKRVVAEAIEASEQRLRDEMQMGFDALAKRLDRLETEYHMLVAGLKRVEERLDRVEQRLDKMALRSELLELKARVDGLQEQVRTLEARLEQ